MKAFIASFDAITSLLIALAFAAILMESLASYKFDVSKITVARTAQDVLVLAEEKGFDPASIKQIFEMSPFCHVLEIYHGDTLIEVHTKAGCEVPSEEQVTWREFYNADAGAFYFAKLISWG